MARRDVLLVRASSAACEAAVEAVVEGRAGVVLADDESDLLPIAIAAASAGFAVVSQRVIDGAAAMPPLTGTDRRILEVVSRGGSNADIARALGCSVATAKREVLRLARVLGAEGRAGLIEITKSLGL